MQDVANATQVDLGSGLTYKDIRIGGGPSIQQDFLTVLHYRQSHPAKRSYSFQMSDMPGQESRLCITLMSTDTHRGTSLYGSSCD